MPEITNNETSSRWDGTKRARTGGLSEAAARQNSPMTPKIEEEICTRGGTGKGEKYFELMHLMSAGQMHPRFPVSLGFCVPSCPGALAR